MSVMKSERECIASAIMAALLPSIPAMNLKSSSKRLPTLPIRVVLYIFFLRRESICSFMAYI